MLNDIKRISTTAKFLIRNEGVTGVLRSIYQRAVLSRRLSPFKGAKSVGIDGCTFDVGRLPNLPIKLALLKKNYEDFERRAILRHIRPELPVIELGGCIGVVACITNKTLKDAKAHVVVEANPNVIPHLERNRAANQCSFEILNSAIAYDREFVTFVPSMDFWGSSLEQKNGGEPVTVKSIQLQDIVDRRNFESFTLICDIEGHEYDLIMHETDALKNADVIILETHARLIGDAKTVELLNELQVQGFVTIDQDSFVYVLRRSPELC